MNSFYTVFIFELQNGKYLLCPSTDDCSALECMFMYPEAGTFGSIEAARLITTVKQVESWQIDGLVHLYMHKYGTDNVIGGSYQKFGQATSTSDQIKFIVDGLEELNERKEKCRKLQQMDSLGNSREPKSPLAEAPSRAPSVPLAEAPSRELSVPLDSIDNYKSQIQMYENLVELKNQYHIDRSIIGEFGWLQSLIINGPEFNGSKTKTFKGDFTKKYDYDRYNTLMNNLAQICKKAIFYGIIEKKYYTHNPHLLFDSSVFWYERQIINIEPELKIFEQAIYTLINREDELLFDIEQIDIYTIRDKLLYKTITSQFQ
jgi:hypothetical protein